MGKGRVKFDLTGRVAIVTGGSRGIGRECCLTLARQGCNIVVAAKSTKGTKELPGSIFTVAEEVRKLGVKALAVQCNVIHEESVQNCVKKTIEEFGRVDVLINNASSLWWHTIEDTPMKRYDLIHSINARGSFCMAKYCLPHMKKNKWGRVVCMSPPINSEGFRGRTAYNHSKMGMTMVAMGIAEEYRGKGITANALWPATVIESQASINFKLGDPRFWRKADIIADAMLGLIADADFTGHAVIDDEYLKSRHDYTEDDLMQYSCDPSVKPVRALANEAEYARKKEMIKRGDVRKLRKDMESDEGPLRAAKL